MKLGEYTARRIPYIVEALFRDCDFTLRGVERRHVEQVLEAVDGNISLAARMLGIARRSLQRKLRRKH